MHMSSCPHKCLYTCPHTGLVLGASSTALYAGLWGYNASLCAIALGGMFYVLSLKTLLLASSAAVVAAMMMPTVAALLAHAGVPALTYPFCFTILPFVLLQGYGISATTY